ncbi:MAG: hypothetical protein ACJ8AW_04180 [Rhodopila sp.]
MMADEPDIIVSPEMVEIWLDGTAVAEWAASPRGVLKFRPHSVGIDRH